MSINRIYQNVDELQFEKYNFIISKFSVQMRGALTIEKLIVNEGHVIDYIDSLDSLEYKELTEFNQFRSRDIILTENTIKDSLDLSRLQAQILRKRFLSYHNESKIALDAIVGKVKRIKQKQAALDLWNNNYIKYCVSEKFNNMDNIKYNFVSGKKLNVEVKQGVLTLPIQKETRINISNISISSGNGNAGNSDLEVNYNTLNLMNLIDGDTNTWFEYERLDSGPVRLNLTIELRDESIVNYIEISPYLIDGFFRIKDIKYSGNSRDYKSIKDLTLVEGDSFYTPKQIDSGNLWNISFMPIKTKTITLVLEGNFMNYIKVSGANGVSERKRYSIGIREIGVKKIKYSQSGSINSSVLPLLENCYIGEADLKILPENESLYDIDFDVSTDGGNSWGDVKGNSFIVEDEKKLVYKMNIVRNDGNFSNASTFEKKEDNSYLKIKHKSCSKKISPNTLTVNEKTTEDDIFVYQKSGIILSNKPQRSKTIYKNKRLNPKLFQSNATTRSYVYVPFKNDLSDYNIFSNDIQVYVDNEIFSEVLSESDLNETDNTYYIQDDFSNIVFHKDRLEYGSRVKFKIKPQELNFFKREKKFFSKFDNYFNPTKSSIRLECLSSRRKKFVEKINKNKSIFKLNRRGIIKDSINFKNTINRSFTDGDGKENVKASGSNINYHLNERKSIMYLPEMNFDGIVNIEYEANEILDIIEDEYEIWFEDGVPKGIFIEESDFVSEDVTEVLDLTLSAPAKYSLRENMSFSRKDTFPGNKKVFTLSNKNIVAGTVRLSPEVFGKSSSFDISPIEVPFLDGKSEFLDLKKIEKEKTIEILSDVNGLLSFKLAAGSLWYHTLGITIDSEDFLSFKNSKNSIASIGDYFIDGNGIVTVKIEPVTKLTGDKNISYYYKEKIESDKYRYSVDYNFGILYLSEEISVGNKSKIYYKTSNYSAAYEIVDKIENFRYNKKSKRIEVDSGYLSDKTDIFGVAYLVKDIKVSLEELKEYFTPFIDRIVFRFK